MATKENYHTAVEVDVSHMTADERKALYNTTGTTVEVWQSSKATTRRARDSWFECPVTGEWLPRAEGVRYRGILYSRDAAMDLLEEDRRRRL